MKTLNCTLLVLLTLNLASCGSKNEKTTTTINGVQGVEAAFKPFVGAQNLTNGKGDYLYLMDGNKFKYVSDDTVEGSFTYNNTTLTLPGVGEATIMDYTENDVAFKCLRINDEYIYKFCMYKETYIKNL